MPLTSKGQKIMSAMKEEYGEEKGEQVFYASKNAGRITGVDAMRLPTIDEFRQRFADAVREGLPLPKCLAMGTTWTGMNSGTTGFQGDAFRRSFRDSLDKGMSIRDAIKKAVDASAPSSEEVGAHPMSGAGGSGFGPGGEGGSEMYRSKEPQPWITPTTPSRGSGDASPAKLDLGNTSGKGVPMHDAEGSPNFSKISSTQEWLTMGQGKHPPENQPLSQKTDLGKISGDCRAFFRGAVADALNSGKSFRDAIRYGLDQVAA